MIRSATIIEPARMEDRNDLADLLSDLFLKEGEYAPHRQRQLEAIDMLISRSSAGRILVARDGAQVVGMVSLLTTISTACGGPVGILEDLVVKATWRGRGLGADLLDAAIDLARRSGFGRITVLTDPRNALSQSLYRRRGFTDSPMRILRLPLDHVQ